MKLFVVSVPMVYTCFICKQRSDKSQDLSFHKFPVDSQNRQEWLDAAGRSGENPKTGAAVCSRHFHRDCFRYGLVNGKRFLKTGSKPTLELQKHNENSVESSIIHLVEEPLIDRTPDCIPSNYSPQDDAMVNSQMVKPETSNKRVLEMPETIGIPRKKIRFNNLTWEEISKSSTTGQVYWEAVKQKLNNRQRKIECLQRTVRRLRQRVKSTKLLMKHLVKKNFLMKKEVKLLRQYDWGAIETGYILSSFFWGYTVTQIPAGYIAKRWSAKNLLTIGVLVCAVLSLLTSVAADYGGWPLVCVCRVGMGLSQSVVLPCIHTLLSNWAPPHERARLGSVTYSGAQFGTVLSNVISGALAESRAGWPSVFYFFGIASIIWTIVFIFYGADSPSTDARIHEDEKRYIERSLGSGLDDKPDQQIAKTPWREIFTSPPVWALVVAHCGQNWGFWMLITEISIYMSSILGFKLSENGFKAALPYLTMMLLAFPISWLSDYALKKGVRRIILRKIANTLSQWGPGLALIGLCFTERGDTTLPVVILVIGVGANVGSLCGFQINHIDLSPNYAGILMSITNCFASVVAIIAPLVVSVIVTNKSDFSQWQTVFYLSAGIYFTSNTIFLIFASAERQWWDDPRAVEVTRSRQVFVNAIAVEP